MTGTHTQGRAVVLGGSMAGLLAASALAGSYPEVIVVDRDELSGVTDYRRSVPHGRHAHGLIARGHRILEARYPGLKQELDAAGVLSGDFSRDIRWTFNGLRMSPCDSGLTCVPAIRPLLEYHVRARTQALPNVTFLERHDINGLVTTPDRGRVTGTRVQARDGSAEKTILSDLVIDITGRGSRMPAWLDELGYQRAEEERVRVDLAYTTRHYRLPHDPFGSDLAIIAAPTPDNPRGAFFHRYQRGPGQVELSLTGMCGDHPPTDPAGFLEFARSLPIPEIYQAVRDGEPLDDPVMFRFPASVWRHYERLARFPEGLLVMGDAMCSFNPVYAQGMSVSAIESEILADHISRDLVPSPRDFFTGAARAIRGAWDVSVGADLGFPGVEGRRTLKTRFANAYVSRLQAAAVHDAALTKAFMRVAGLVDPPQALMRPGTMLRVLRPRRRPAAVPAATEQGTRPEDLAA